MCLTLGRAGAPASKHADQALEFSPCFKDEKLLVLYSKALQDGKLNPASLQKLQKARQMNVVDVDESVLQMSPAVQSSLPPVPHCWPVVLLPFDAQMLPLPVSSHFSFTPQPDCGNSTHIAMSGVVARSGVAKSGAARSRAVDKSRLAARSTTVASTTSGGSASPQPSQPTPPSAHAASSAYLMARC